MNHQELESEYSSLIYKIAQQVHSIAIEKEVETEEIVAHFERYWMTDDLLKEYYMELIDVHIHSVVLNNRTEDFIMGELLVVDDYNDFKKDFKNEIREILAKRE